MSYGFESKSTASGLEGTALFSSDISQLHHFETKVASSSVQMNTVFGGCRVFSYTTTLGGDYPPVIFLRPKAGALLASVVRLAGSSGAWAIDVAQESTTTTGPDVLIFSRPDAIPKTGLGSYGMQLFDSSGKSTFDSRLRPLSIVATQNVTPQSVAANHPPGTLYANGGYYSINTDKYNVFSFSLTTTNLGYSSWWRYNASPYNLLLTADFNTTATRNTYPITVASDPAQLIYSSNSSGQAAYHTAALEGVQGNTHWYGLTWDWWGFYREGVALSGANVINGWIPYRGSIFQGDTGLLDNVPFIDYNFKVLYGLYIAVPFVNQTKNIQQSQVIVADGSLYP